MMQKVIVQDDVINGIIFLSNIKDRQVVFNSTIVAKKVECVGCTHINITSKFLVPCNAVLFFEDCRFDNLSQCIALRQAQTLSFRSCGLTNVSPFVGTHCEVLDLTDNDISDISILRNLPFTRKLYISDNLNLKSIDIRLPSIRGIDISCTAITSLASLRGHRHLYALRANNTCLDMVPDIPKLSIIELENTSFTRPQKISVNVQSAYQTMSSMCNVKPSNQILKVILKHSMRGPINIYALGLNTYQFNRNMLKLTFAEGEDVYYHFPRGVKRYKTTQESSGRYVFTLND